ncbi:alpha/beta hydrolase [Mucilaginibacter sp. HMF7410]|uniref:Alpha/beta hydrolase n=1 Tax=Mucilaginibacter arboris TaxID=2682090 RepID=A0A7K1STN3_9SPHI|nr:alpha/beta hydrolase [Mucilaginibacter arboris]
MELNRSELQQDGHTASENVYIISDEYPIPRLATTRRIWIYLPPDYHAETKSYPVLYMHDGQNLFDNHSASFGEWGVDEYLDSVGKPEIIVVGIDHGNNERLLEYNPYDSEHGVGKGNAYVDFLVYNLKPYIDSNFRTQKGASCTSIAGSSMGGLISMYAAVKYPDVFGNAGVFSPAFWMAPAIFSFAEEKELPGSSGFYFICGDLESGQMVPDMEKMASIIAQKNLKQGSLKVEVIVGGRHEEKLWQESFPKFYQWLMATC